MVTQLGFVLRNAVKVHYHLSNVLNALVCHIAAKLRDLCLMPLIHQWTHAVLLDVDTQNDGLDSLIFLVRSSTNFSSLKYLSISTNVTDVDR